MPIMNARLLWIPLLVVILVGAVGELFLGNVPGTSVRLWSVLGGATLPLGLGVVLWLYGRVGRAASWQAARHEAVATQELVDRAKPTPTQRATHKFVAVAIGDGVRPRAIVGARHPGLSFARLDAFRFTGDLRDPRAEEAYRESNARAPESIAKSDHCIRPDHR